MSNSGTRRVGAILVWTLVASSTVILGQSQRVSTPSSAGASNLEGGECGMFRHECLVLDALFPLVVPEDSGLGGAQWWVSGRVVPADADEVFHWVFVKYLNGRVRLEAVVGREIPWSSGFAPPTTTEGESLEATRNRLRSARVAVSSEQCPALRSLARSFERMELAAVPSFALVTHRTVFNVRVASGSCSTTVVTDLPDHRLSAWIEALRKAAEPWLNKPAND